MEREQQKEIVDFLFTKNLPLDLLLEVEDHFKEQIAAQEDGGKSFDEAFAAAKIAWEKDLKITRNIFGRRKTNLEREALRQTNREKNATALKIFVPYFLLVIFFAIVHPPFAKLLIISANAVVGLWCLYITVRNLKLIHSGSKYYEKRKIALAQKKMTLVGFGIQSLIFGVFVSDSQFQNFIEALRLLPNFNHTFFSLIFPFAYLYCGILGILYFNDYKKAVKILQDKINFKL